MEVDADYEDLVDESPKVGKIRSESRIELHYAPSSSRLQHFQEQDEDEDDTRGDDDEDVPCSVED